MWSQKILNVASSGTAMNAPPTPQIHHQNDQPDQDRHRVEREPPAQDHRA